MKPPRPSLDERLRQMLTASSPDDALGDPVVTPPGTRAPIVTTAPAPDWLERAGSAVSTAVRRAQLATRKAPTPVRKSVQLLRQLTAGGAMPAHEAQAIAAKNERLFDTALGDSLRQLSGGGRPSGKHRLRVSGYQPGVGVRAKGTGYYFPLGDQLTVGSDPHPAVKTAKERETLIHEFGHRRQFRTMPGLKKLFAPGELKVDADNREARAYAKVNRKEAYAGAFQSAFDVLADLQANPEQAQDPRQVSARLAQHERRDPGTTTLFWELLRDPLYQQHASRPLLATRQRTKDTQ